MWTQRYTQKKECWKAHWGVPGDNRGGDWSDVFTGHQEWLPSPRSYKRQRRSLPQRLQRKRGPANTLISDFQLPELQENKCGFLQGAYGQDFVTVILGSGYNHLSKWPKCLSINSWIPTEYLKWPEEDCLMDVPSVI